MLERIPERFGEVAAIGLVLAVDIRDHDSLAPRSLEGVHETARETLVHDDDHVGRQPFHFRAQIFRRELSVAQDEKYTVIVVVAVTGAVDHYRVAGVRDGGQLVHHLSEMLGDGAANGCALGGRIAAVLGRDDEDVVFLEAKRAQRAVGAGDVALVVAGVIGVGQNGVSLRMRGGAAWAGWVRERPGPQPARSRPAPCMPQLSLIPM